MSIGRIQKTGELRVFQFLAKVRNLGVAGVDNENDCATRCRLVECTQALACSTRHVPAGLYAGVLAVRCAVGAKPREQCTESGLNGDRRTHRGILPR